MNENKFNYSNYGSEAFPYAGILKNRTQEKKKYINYHNILGPYLQSYICLPNKRYMY